MEKKYRDKVTLVQVNSQGRWRVEEIIREQIKSGKALNFVREQVKSKSQNLNNIDRVFFYYHPEVDLF